MAILANPLRAYSGLKYLCQALERAGIETEMWALIPASMLHETETWGFPVHSFLTTWYGSIPRLRAVLACLQLVWMAVTRRKHVIFADLLLFPAAALLKVLHPGALVVQYCSELFTSADEPRYRYLLWLYGRLANLPDAVIEVEPGRAKLRKRAYRLRQDPVLIPNSIPTWELSDRDAGASLATVAGAPIPEGAPVIVYSGGAFLHRELGTIVAAIAALRTKAFFLAFCYGEPDGIAALRRACGEQLGPDRFHIAVSVERQKLLSVLAEADLGIVYYRPSATIGNKYAAPTKLFEYIAAGLPVVTSNNPGVVRLVERLNLGVCVKDESVEALTLAIDAMLSDPKRRRAIHEKERECFVSTLSYDVLAKDGIARLAAMFSAAL